MPVITVEPAKIILTPIVYREVIPGLIGAVIAEKQSSVSIGVIWHFDQFHIHAGIKILLVLHIWKRINDRTLNSGDIPGISSIANVLVPIDIAVPDITSIPFMAVISKIFSKTGWPALLLLKNGLESLDGSNCLDCGSCTFHV